jgi:hypothetical protein
LRLPTLVRSLKGRFAAHVNEAALFVVLMAVTIIEVALNWARVFPDTPLYVQLGQTGHSYLGPSLEIRLLLPYLAYRLSLIDRSLSVVAGLGLLNAIFWVGSVIVAFKIGAILNKASTGFIMGLFVAASGPELSYGAAALTDSATYFFAGFALLVVLRVRRPRRVSSFLEGAMVAMGPFFHPAAALATIYGLTYGLRRGWRGLWILLGAVTVFLAAVVVAYEFGLIGRAGAFLGVLPYYSLETPGEYGQSYLAQGLSQTFNVFTPVWYQLQRFSVLTHAIFPGLTSPSIWFFVVLLVGLWKIPHKFLFLSYLPLLLVYEVVARFAIDRFLFFAWPFFVPTLVYGILSLARVPAGVMRRILSKPGFRNVGLLTSPEFYAAVFVILLAIDNTKAYTVYYHLFPPF